MFSANEVGMKCGKEYVIPSAVVPGRLWPDIANCSQPDNGVGPGGACFKDRCICRPGWKTSENGKACSNKYLLS